MNILIVFLKGTVIILWKQIIDKPKGIIHFSNVDCSKPTLCLNPVSFFVGKKEVCKKMVVGDYVGIPITWIVLFPIDKNSMYKKYFFFMQRFSKNKVMPCFLRLPRHTTLCVNYCGSPCTAFEVARVVNLKLVSTGFFFIIW